MKLKILALFIGFLIIGCNPNYNKIFEENILEFEKQQKKFEQVKVFIQDSDFKLNEEVPINKFSTDFQEIAKELGIASVEINNYRSCDENSITFNIEKGWNIDDLNVIQFIYDSCRKDTKKRQHKYDGRHMDFWGLGDNWLMFSDTDFI